LADALERALAAQGVAVTRGHFRPGILFNRGSNGPVTDPHRDPPRGILASLAKLALVFADHVLGALTAWRHARRRGVLLVERGWHDMAVDPGRYRLPGSLRGVVLALGRALPRHDLTVLGDASAPVIFDRKPELDIPEIERQRAEWSTLARATGREVMVAETTERPPDEVAADVLRRLRERRASAPWLRTPIAPTRLALSMQRTRASIPALEIYRPHRRRARVAARVNAALASRGIGRRVPEPVPGLAELAREAEIAYDGVAAFRSSMPGRYVVGFARGGRLRHVAKIGAASDEGLRREGEALQLLNGAVLPARVPRLTWRGEWRGRRVVVTEALAGASLAELDLSSVADLCTALCTGIDGRPLVHGDLAPWNLLRGADGAYLLDWEEYREAFEPLYDLTHYVIRSGALLGRFSPQRSFEVLTSPGSPGWRHLESLRLDPASALERVRAYLDRNRAAPTVIRRFQAEVLELTR